MSRLFKKLSRSSSNLKTEQHRETYREQKLVVAHFMVGNTAPYSSSDWEDDIRLASKHGIDGFALNVGKEDWQLDQVDKCFEASERCEVHFKLFLSFDMSSLPFTAPDDVCFLKEYVSRFARRTNYLLYGGKALVSTFAGENAFFGRSDCDSAWTFVKACLEEICPITFVPGFFINPLCFPTMRCLDGVFNWNGCWPIHLSPDSPPEEIRYPKLLSDIDHLRNLRLRDGSRKVFMASVSPWFFTHYGEDSWNKNWIYRGDDWLLVRRWQQLIDMRNDVDIVQIISWNDYGESHYVGPIKGAQPNSEAWVNGFDHTPWLHLCGLFARAFKADNMIPDAMTGNEDYVYAWARTHPRDAIACEDAVGRPRGWELTEDVFWVVVLARAPAYARLASGEFEMKRRIGAGLTLLSCPLTVGGEIIISMLMLQCIPHILRQ